MNRASLTILLVVAALVALVMGVTLVERPGVVIPLVFESLLFLGLTVGIIRRLAPAEDRRFLGGVVAAGATLRVAAIAIVYGAASPLLFAPDTASYYARGLAIVRSWRGAPAPEFLSRWQVGYEYLNAWAIGLLEDPTWALVVLNIFAALWTIVFAFAIARACFGTRSARVAAVLVALFPSLVLWSVLNVRDALATMAVSLMVLIGVRTYGRVRLVELVLFAVVGVLLSTLRDYVSFLVLTGLLVGLAAALRPGRGTATLAMGIVIVLMMIFGLEQLDIFRPEVLDSPLQAASQLRRGLHQDFGSGLAGSAFGVQVEINGAGDALRYLPLGLTFFLFAPFPWAITSMLQASTLPEVLLWYGLVPFTVMGLAQSRRREARAGMLVLGVIAVTVTSYALVEGNFGTAYRHRAQVMPLLLVFAARGLAQWWTQRMSRERTRRERAAAARLARAPRPHVRGRAG